MEVSSRLINSTQQENARNTTLKPESGTGVADRTECCFGFLIDNLLDAVTTQLVAAPPRSICAEVLDV
jgi:hypothetical protein